MWCCKIWLTVVFFVLWPWRWHPAHQNVALAAAPSAMPEREEEASWADGVLSHLAIRGEGWNKFARDIAEDTIFEDDYYNHAELRVRVEYIPNETWHVISALEADYVVSVFSLDSDAFLAVSNNDVNHEAEVRPHDVYLNLATASFNVRIGNQIVTWGKADEVSPLNLVNPEDLRDGFVRPRTERKLPIPMVNVEYFSGLYKLQALLIPRFVKSKLDLLGSDWAFLGQVNRQVGAFAIAADEPSTSLSNMEVGVRVAGTVEALDFAFSYLYTHDDLPSIDTVIIPAGFPPLAGSPALSDVARLAQLTGQALPLKYDRQHVFGFEFETIVGSFGLRGDVAYIWQKGYLQAHSATGELRAINRPLFRYVLGADYQGSGAFYANLQFSQIVVLDYAASILFVDEIDHQVNGKVSQEVFDHRVKLALRFLVDITSRSYYVNPQVIFQYWENVHIEIGSDLLGGPKNRPIGFFADNSQVYGILRVFF